jgi:hypothetical protein
MLAFESDDRFLAVIVGAGASFDCVTDSDVSPLWRPPLAKALFENRSPTFTEILAQYPGAENLADQIRSGLANQINLETILRRFSESPNTRTRRDIRHVPLYLQHLIGDVSEFYIKVGGSAFQTLVRTLDESDYTKVLYLTVNYDLFLDRALERHYRFKFQNLSDYVRRPEKWSLVKLHGSVQWFRKILNQHSGSNDVSALLAELSDQELRFGDVVELLDGHKGAHRFRRSDDGPMEFWYPALAAPVEGKKDFMCPDEHVQTAQAFLRRCSDFVFFGFSGLDAHVLALLKQVPCVKRFTVVTEDQATARETIERICAANSQFEVVPAEFPSVGFGNFMRMGRLDAFLEKARAPEATT